MKAKYKMTGCARFMIFLVILIPIAYFGSKYLRDSGTWDKIKDKIENKDGNSVERSIEDNRDRLDPITLDNSDTGDRYDKLRSAYEEQEKLISEQQRTIEELRGQVESLKNNQPTQTDQATIPPPVNVPSTRTNPTPSSGGTPSLDDLLREADGSSGTSGTSPSTSGSSSARLSIGRWQFSFSGSQGDLEFYQQNGKLLSRITLEGDNRVNVDELQRSGQDRFNVVNSQTGEYYILRSNGDLDAYDQNGFQTTCRYVN